MSQPLEPSPAEDPVARRRGFRSLGWRILAWMSIVSLGPLLIMSYQGYHCAREALVESQAKHLRSVADSRAARIDAWLSEVKADFNFLALAPCAIGMCNQPREAGAIRLAASCCDFLDNVSRSNPAYLVIASFDPGWNRVSLTRGPTSISATTFSSGFKRRLEASDGVQVSNPVRHTGGEIRFLVGHPILGQGGAKIGFIVALVDPTRALAPILDDRSGLGETGTVLLLTPDGVPLAWSRNADPVGSLPARVLADAPTGVVAYRDGSGKTVIGTSSPLPDLHTRIGVQVDEAEAFAWLHWLRIRALATGIATFAVVLLLSWRIARRLSRPMRELAEVARRIGKGRHDERLQPFQEPEAAEVAAAFNFMLDELAARQERLSHTAALASVGALTSSIVHEMRNPLSSVKMNLQALKKTVEADAAHAELAQIAVDQTNRLERMLTDLLNFGKPLEIEPRSIRFADLARNAVDDVRNRIDAKGVTIRFEDRLEDTPIKADPEQLRRAVANLVANAVQAAPENGHVSISGELAAGPPPQAVISVTDDGPGIPETNLDRLFRPFFTTREGGTGLGLANVKKIAEYHGGTAVARNAKPGGATFSICLPAGGPGEARDRDPG